MEEVKKSQFIKASDYINKNCWLVKTLNYSPLTRCRYCELKFSNCPFFQYLIGSLILIFFSFYLLFFVEGEVSDLAIVIIFVMVVVYGYFFNKSVGEFIQVNFERRKTNEALEELKDTLQIQVEARTAQLRELAKSLEEQVKKRTEELQRKVEELEKFQKFTVDRELKMIELKKEIEKLKKELEKYKDRKLINKL